MGLDERTVWAAIGLAEANSRIIDSIEERVGRLEGERRTIEGPLALAPDRSGASTASSTSASGLRSVSDQIRLDERRADLMIKVARAFTQFALLALAAAIGWCSNQTLQVPEVSLSQAAEVP